MSQASFFLEAARAPPLPPPLQGEEGQGQEGGPGPCRREEAGGQEGGKPPV